MPLHTDSPGVGWGAFSFINCPTCSSAHSPNHSLTHTHPHPLSLTHSPTHHSPTHSHSPTPSLPLSLTHPLTHHPPIHHSPSTLSHSSSRERVGDSLELSNMFISYENPILSTRPLQSAPVPDWWSRTWARLLRARNPSSLANVLIALMW